MTTRKLAEVSNDLLRGKRIIWKYRPTETWDFQNVVGLVSKPVSMEVSQHAVAVLDTFNDIYLFSVQGKQIGY